MAHSAEDEMYENIAGALVANEEPMSMSEIARACQLVDEDQSVHSKLSAKIRLRLKKLIDAKLVSKSGAKATTRYKALKKLTDQYN